MKKNVLVLASLWVFSAVANELTDVQAKLKSIETDIEKIQGFIKNGEAPEVYGGYLKQLQEEKSKYEKLARRLEKSSDRPKTDKIDPVAKKLFLPWFKIKFRVFNNLMMNRYRFKSVMSLFFVNCLDQGKFLIN